MTTEEYDNCWEAAALLWPLAEQALDQSIRDAWRRSFPETVTHGALYTAFHDLAQNQQWFPSLYELVAATATAQRRLDYPNVPIEPIEPARRITPGRRTPLDEFRKSMLSAGEDRTVGPAEVLMYRIVAGKVVCPEGNGEDWWEHVMSQAFASKESYPSVSSFFAHEDRPDPVPVPEPIPPPPATPATVPLAPGTSAENLDHMASQALNAAKQARHDGRPFDWMALPPDIRERARQLAATPTDTSAGR